MFQKATNFLHKLEHNLTNEPGKDGWSHICGGVDGKPFEFVNQRFVLVGVKGHAGTLVDKMQFLFVDPQTGQFQSTPEIGGHGGQPFSIECPSGTYITKIHVWSGSAVDAVQFVTNTGMESAKFGGKGGDRHVIDSKGKHFCGVKGLAKEVITQICFGISA